MQIKACTPHYGVLVKKIVQVVKITTAFLIGFCLHVSARGYSQEKITLDLKGVTLENVLQHIKQQTGIPYLIVDQYADEVKKIDISVRDASLEAVLDLCFKGYALTYSIINGAIIIRKQDIPKTDQETPPLGPIKDIAGRITDSAGIPLGGAFIQILGSGRTVSSNDEGYFYIKGAHASDTLLVTFIGYATQRVAVTDRSSLNITLRLIGKQLSQVIVNYNSGYNRISPELATGSYNLVDKQLFNQRISSDVLDRLEGNVPGLIFNKNTAGSNQGQFDINIQGHSTLFSNDQPLIVVDNFAYDGDINNINPNDVEAVTILKDAEAASRWGVRSGNGVIVITTKKGKKDQNLITEFNSNVTIGEKPNLFYNRNHLDSRSYIPIEQNLFNQGYYNGTLSDSTALVTPVVRILGDEKSRLILANQANAEIEALKGNDIRQDLKSFFYRKSVAQQYYLGLHGGSSKADYYFSGGYDNSLSSVVGNRNDRISLISNINFYPMKRLQLSVGLNYVSTNVKSNGSNTPALSNLYPYAKLVDNSGNPLAVSTDYSERYKENTATLGFLNWQDKPLQEISFGDNTRKGIDNKINLGLRYDLLSGLSFEMKYQYERESLISRNYYSDSTYYARSLINEFTQIGSNRQLSYPIPVSGILQEADAYLTSQQVRGQLNYQKGFSNGNEISGIFGSELRQAVSESNSNTIYGFDKNTYASVSAIDYFDYFPGNPYTYAQIPNNLSYQKTISNFVSYYSNLYGTLHQQYTLSLSGRIDHSNIFGVATNKKAVPLYSVGVGWNINNAHFYTISWLPYLHPRVTFGYNANINTSASAITTITENSGSPYNGFNYATITSPGNPELTWEKIKKENFGIDFSFKNHFVFGSIDLYNKQGIHLFGSSPLAPSSGQTSFFGNTASTKGKGFDLAINVKIVDNKNVKWLSEIMASHAEDKVTKYYVKSTALNLLSYGSGNVGVIVPVIGANEFGIYSLPWAGLSAQNGDPEGIINGKPSNNYTAILQNITVDSLVYNGPARPQYFGSWRNTISYKKISLSFNIFFKFDYFFVKTAMSNVASVASGSFGGIEADYTHAWKAPGDEKTTNVPSIQYPTFDANRSTFYQYSSVLVDRADNIRLSDINLSYDLRNSIRALKRIQSFKVYLYLNNVGIIWRANRDKIDPDIYSSGPYGYPSPRTISFGFSATF
ncbi:MAG TPA: SusC/RagA family TonB-linked outer membrane protein [Puia sp.]|jgi:TonB-linked SusC/RagA family outer membrane protein